MSYADELESRAQAYDADDTECLACGHPWSFHRSDDLATERLCCYIIGSKVVRGGITCDCAGFVELEAK